MVGLLAEAGHPLRAGHIAIVAELDVAVTGIRPTGPDAEGNDAITGVCLAQCSADSPHGIKLLNRATLAATMMLTPGSRTSRGWHRPRTARCSRLGSGRGSVRRSAAAVALHDCRVLLVGHHRRDVLQRALWGRTDRGYVVSGAAQTEEVEELLGIAEWRRGQNRLPMPPPAMITQYVCLLAVRHRREGAGLHDKGKGEGLLTGQGRIGEARKHAGGCPRYFRQCVVDVVDAAVVQAAAPVSSGCAAARPSRRAVGWFPGLVLRGSSSRERARVWSYPRSTFIRRGLVQLLPGASSGARATASILWEHLGAEGAGSSTAGIRPSTPAPCGWCRRSFGKVVWWANPCTSTTRKTSLRALFTGYAVRPATVLPRGSRRACSPVAS